MSIHSLLDPSFSLPIVDHPHTLQVSTSSLQVIQLNEEISLFSLLSLVTLLPVLLPFSLPSVLYKITTIGSERE